MSPKPAAWQAARDALARSTATPETPAGGRTPVAPPGDGFEREAATVPPAGPTLDTAARVEADDPGNGWHRFGTHVDCPVRLDFLGEGEDGMPVWERVVLLSAPNSPTETLARVRALLRCICNTGPGTEGPSQDCPVHGDENATHFAVLLRAALDPGTRDQADQGTRQGPTLTDDERQALTNTLRDVFSAGQGRWLDYRDHVYEAVETLLAARTREG